MKKTIIALAISSVFISFITISYAVYCDIIFEKNCENWLSLAAKANSIDLASDRLNKAIQYIDSNNLDKGSTHILWQTPFTSLEMWSQNLKAAQSELNIMKSKSNISDLEKSNVLLKLHETLTGEHDTIVCPENISIYPFQTLYYAVLIVGLTSVVIFVSIWFCKWVKI